MIYVPPLAKLIDEFAKMPGIGHKTAARLAFYVLRLHKEQAKELVNAIMAAKDSIGFCSICQNLTDIDPCAVCTSHKRNGSIICVVESPKDVIALERTKDYDGLYHVLHGHISPMEGIRPEDIKVKELITRLSDSSIKEIILATNPTVEGEATAMYLARLIKPLGIKVTRIAHGIPVGGDLEFADEVTLSRAIEGRREV